MEKIYVLDTNVLLHDPMALYAFNEHRIVIPMTVLEELDTIKDRKDKDVSREARIAINAIAMSGVGLLTYLADDQQLRTLTFWSLGSIGRATWDGLLGALPFLLAPLILIPRLARALNAFLLGEAEANHLGVDADRVKRWLVVWVALGVGAAVAVAGIGFRAI